MAHIIGAGSRSDRHSIDLETSMKSWIPNERRLPRSPESMNAAKEMLLREHTAWKFRSLRSDYNCMGMVFACRRTWVDPEHFSMIARDDGYRKLNRTADAMVGDIAVYTSKMNDKVVHVGVIVFVDHDLEHGATMIKVLSQFGADGEYIHPADDLPHAMALEGGKIKLTVWTEVKQ